MRDLSIAEIDVVSGAWSWSEFASSVVGGGIAGGAGAAAYAWYTGAAYIPAIGAATVGGAVTGAVSYSWNELNAYMMGSGGCL